MSETEALFQGAVVSALPEPEAPAVVFFEMQNGSGTATLHITLRCKNGEDELEFMNRVNSFIVVIDPAADVHWTLKDAPRGYAKGGSGFGGQKRTEIQGGQFVITHVTRFEKPHKDNRPDNPKENWSYLRAFGMQNGQEVSADCFFGNSGWAKPDNAVTKCGMFPNFMTWAVDVKKAIPAGQSIIAKVSQHPQYKTYEITSIENAGM